MSVAIFFRFRRKSACAAGIILILIRRLIVKETAGIGVAPLFGLPFSRKALREL